MLRARLLPISFRQLKSSRICSTTPFQKSRISRRYTTSAPHSAPISGGWQVDNLHRVLFCAVFGSFYLLLAAAQPSISPKRSTIATTTPTPPTTEEPYQAGLSHVPHAQKIQALDRLRKAILTYLPSVNGNDRGSVRRYYDRLQLAFFPPLLEKGEDEVLALDRWLTVMRPEIHELALKAAKTNTSIAATQDLYQKTISSLTQTHNVMCLACDKLQPLVTYDLAKCSGDEITKLCDQAYYTFLSVRTTPSVAF